MPGGGPLHESGEDTLVDIHVVPRAKKNALVGLHGDRLKVAVAAPPADGKANTMLTSFLAQCLGVPRRRVQLVSGASGRRKRVCVTGMHVEEVARRLGLDDSLC